MMTPRLPLGEARRRHPQIPKKPPKNRLTLSYQLDLSLRPICNASQPVCNALLHLCCTLKHAKSLGKMRVVTPVAPCTPYAHPPPPSRSSSSSSSLVS